MPKKILVGILDWGLGHATRSVPLISYLLQTKCQIFIATSGPQKKILQEAFPKAVFLDPPQYNIQYPSGGKQLTLSILRQLPRFKKLIDKEHQWVQKVVSEKNINLIISDNRYGFHAPGIRSAFITHQLSPRSGFGPVADLVARKLHYGFIRSFDECWVPDLESNGGLAGALSHPPSLPDNVTYIGPLSRFLLGEDTLQESTLGEYGILAVMSGPEPARTEFEYLIRRQLKAIGKPHLLVRGLPGNKERLAQHELNHAGARELEELMTQAGVVICRSGYTSVMDLVRLRKKAVLVPTPGQTEQEYLAEHLQEKKLFPYLAQDRLDIKKAVSIADTFEYRFPEVDFDAYKKTLDRFINK
jgi:UDP:flavonoid glycosyltransferase YjiC (YdhE family)